MISVVIPTRDRLGPLNRALRSLARQTFRDVQVLVVNDGGPTPQAVVDAWSPELRILLIDLPKSVGAAQARSTAIARAERPFLAFLDDDDVWFPRHLETGVATFQATGCDLAYGAALVSPTWIEAGPREETHLPRKDYPFDDRFLHVANFIHTSAVVTRNFSDRPARFDARLSHCEDWDMWLTLHRDLGYTFAYTGYTTTVYHQLPQRDGLVSSGYQNTPSAFTTGRAIVYDKHPSSDLAIAEYREWFRTFDARLDRLIASNSALPANAFEHAVRRAYYAFNISADADPGWLDDILCDTPDDDRARPAQWGCTG